MPASLTVCSIAVLYAVSVTCWPSGAANTIRPVAPPAPPYPPFLSACAISAVRVGTLVWYRRGATDPVVDVVMGLFDTLAAGLVEPARSGALPPRPRYRGPAA